MSSKFPWVAATVIIVIAAGLGAWALSTPATTTPPSAGTARIVGGGSLGGDLSGSVWALQSDNNGIENIYIIDTGTGNDNANYKDQPLVWIVPSTAGDSVIQAGDNTVNIPYENTFDIVTAVWIQAENVAYLDNENVQVYLSITGTFSDTDNTEVAEADGTDFDVYESLYEHLPGNQNLSGYVRINFRADNAGNGYYLPAGGSINITATVYAWK